MKFSVETFLDVFLRTCEYPFTTKEVVQLLQYNGVKMRFQDIELFLKGHPLVFPVSETEYLTRAGLFTGRYFSIRPTRFELDQGILIAGDRCLPFVDPEMLPDEIRFCHKGHMFASTVVSVPSGDVFELYALFGDEYIPQYISFDPANEDVDFSVTNYEIPAQVNITAVNMEHFYQKYKFRYGDRLLAKVSDWDAGTVEITPLCRRKDNPFKQDETDEKRKKWYEDLETAVLDSFERFGPCGSIDEQLAHIFGAYPDVLCIPECGSFEEFMAVTRNVSQEPYGVESRLWYREQEIPAVGAWEDREMPDETDESNIFISLGLPVSDAILDSYVLDSLYRREKDCQKLFSRIIPESCYLDEYQQVLVILRLVQKRDTIRNGYNWFADYAAGSVRSRALELYSGLLVLMYELGSVNIDLSFFPQQPVVVLSQLFAHASRLVESLQLENSLSSREIHAILLSLDGMEYSFEEIHAELVTAIEKQRKSAFSVIEKKEGQNDQ